MFMLRECWMVAVVMVLFVATVGDCTAAVADLSGTAGWAAGKKTFGSIDRLRAKFNVGQDGVSMEMKEGKAVLRSVGTARLEKEALPRGATREDGRRYALRQAYFEALRSLAANMGEEVESDNGKGAAYTSSRAKLRFADRKRGLVFACKGGVAEDRDAYGALVVFTNDEVEFAAINKKVGKIEDYLAECPVECAMLPHVVRDADGQTWMIGAHGVAADADVPEERCWQASAACARYAIPEFGTFLSWEAVDNPEYLEKTGRAIRGGVTRMKRGWEGSEVSYGCISEERKSGSGKGATVTTRGCLMSILPMYDKLQPDVRKLRGVRNKKGDAAKFYVSAIKVPTSKE